MFQTKIDYGPSFKVEHSSNTILTTARSNEFSVSSYWFLIMTERTKKYRSVCNFRQEQR